ncbi:hypothetical protein Tco_1076376 [Tanacetum coccineum]
MRKLFNNDESQFEGELIPIDEQIKIGLSKFKIALEKSQPDVIYKVCLAILQEYSFFNAFTRIADALEIYMQQFWHTVHYDLTVKAYIFTIDDQDFEVNADWLSEALQITLKVFDHPFVNPPSENGMVIVLGILKFTNKEAKDLVFGMAILNVMLSDEIKDSNDYSEYLAKSSGTQPVKGKGKVKGLITKKDLEVALKNIRVPKKRRLEIMFEELAQSKGLKADTLKGLETIFEAAQFKLDMKKAIKASKDDFIFQQRPRGSGVTPTVLDEPSGNSSSSSSYSDDEIKDIYSDEDDKAAKEKDADKHVADNQPMDEQAEKVQVEKSVPKPQVEKPAVPYPSSSRTLSSAE